MAGSGWVRWFGAQALAGLLALATCGPADATVAHRCGGVPYRQCGPASYCQMTPQQCRIRGGSGVCITRPRICPEIYIPVCGCDGKTYPNDCQAERAGVSVLHRGACSATHPPPLPGVRVGPH